MDNDEGAPGPHSPVLRGGRVDDDAGSVLPDALIICCRKQLYAPSPGSATTAGPRIVEDSLNNLVTLEDVNLGVAAQVAANVCGVKVGPLAVLGRAVDRSGATDVVCETDQGRTTITQTCSSLSRMTPIPADNGWASFA
ncbi:hypothetical protein [Kocuria rhizosphaericola]|uniref:hypothetical protein n=1 Tax=Kocuria rhizosphaericola TaxID=3376284 RepID=UPI00379A63A9